MFTQFDPPIPLYVANNGYASTVIGKGPEHNVIWVPPITESGALLRTPNRRTHMQSNWKIGRPLSAAVKVFKCKVGPVNFRGEDNPSLKEVAR